MEDIRNLLSFSRKMNFWLFFLKAQKCSCKNENTTKSIFLNKHNTLDNLKLPFLCLSCRWPKMRQSLNLIFFQKYIYPSFYSNLNEKFLVNFHYCFAITSYIWFRNNTIHSNMCSASGKCLFVWFMNACLQGQVVLLPAEFVCVIGRCAILLAGRKSHFCYL